MAVFRQTQLAQCDRQDAPFYLMPSPISLARDYAEFIEET
jgi:hypothetical protein